jgi:DNA replication and repair protein RecF
MAISQLSLTDFRNLRSTTLEFNPKFNLICGDNGSGKTSLLEAIFVLCQAHSFRTHQLKQCINNARSGFLLFGRFDGHKAGLAKNDKKLDIHVDGESIKRRSELVRLTPINIVNADSFLLMDGPPQKRRAFLDWCMFHVEPGYAEQWSLFQHALRQRNKLLKSRQDIKLLDYWDQHLIEPSLSLSAMRRDYSIKLQGLVKIELCEILAGIPLELAYQQGWPDELSLADALKNNRERDIRSGFTNAGIHRDDLRFTSEGRNASEILSRGQGKRVCLALLLAALKVVSKSRQNRIILLIDDLHSELDSKAQNQVYQQLLGMDLQMFISNIDSTVPAAISGQKIKLFHVEHGIIRPRKIS